ncbi:MAG TPA: MmcQ/YjbR family DNA-binding protein, partial [Chthoniobacterales bacterium]|nr:MmcQ/YjbR family DNA-binding protein [Chthoniobacterales bacterium]
MRASQFREIALSQPEAVESAYMSHPDFRVGGKVFATLRYPDEEHAVVMLSPDEQEGFVAEMPLAFAAVKGAWGKRGSTQIHLP